MEDENSQHKIDKLQQQAEESNNTANLVGSIFVAILVGGLVSGFNPLVIGILFFVIYGAIKLLR